MGERAAPEQGPWAACSRRNLALLLVTKAELGRLAQVETTLAEYRSSGSAGTPQPSVLRGALVRFKLAGSYRLRPVQRAEAAAAPGGPTHVYVQAPEAATGSAPPVLRRLLLSNVSGTNPLVDGPWETAGQAEVAELAASLAARGLPGLPLAEAAAAAWHKQCALRWHAEHWEGAAHERLWQVPALLADLDDAASLAHVQQQLELGTQTPQLAQLLPSQQQTLPGEPAGLITPHAVLPNGATVAPQTVIAQPPRTSSFPPAAPENPAGGSLAQQFHQLTGAGTLRPASAAGRAAPPAQQLQQQEQSELWERHAPGREQAPIRQPSTRRSPSPGRRHDLYREPSEPLLVPVLLRHFAASHQGRPKPPEWTLIGREVFVSGVQPSVNAVQLRLLLESAGGRVQHLHLRPGDARGDLAWATFSTAKEAASAAEKLQGSQLGSGRLFLRESHTNVTTVQREHPREFEAAVEALKEARLTWQQCIAGAPPARRKESPVAAGTRKRDGTPQRSQSPARQRITSRGRSRERPMRETQHISRSPSQRQLHTLAVPGPAAAGPGIYGIRRHRSRSRSWSRGRTSRGHSRGRSRARHPHPRSHSPHSRSHARSPGARSPARSRDTQQSTRSRSRRRLRRSSSQHSKPTWDPVWRLESECVAALQAEGGTLPLQALFERIHMPPQLGTSSPRCLSFFLGRRQLLFSLNRRDDSVTMLEGADAYVRYKGALLQYLADHPPRVHIRELEHAVPLAPDLPLRLRRTDLHSFVRDFLSDEVWQLGGPNAYRQRGITTAELCPFDGAPSCTPKPRLCQHFQGRTACACPDQEQCPLPHARFRQFK